MKMSLELCDVPGTLGVPEKEWVLTMNGKVIGKCDAKDDPESPAYWYAPEEMGRSPDGRLDFDERLAMADAFMFVSRLSWYA